MPQSECQRVVLTVTPKPTENSVENQVRALEDFAHSNGLELLQVFKDIGVSGARPALKKEGFKKIIDVAEALRIKAIIVYDLTRLGRDVFDVVET